jgi:hypothetical protein
VDTEVLMQTKTSPSVKDLVIVYFTGIFGFAFFALVSYLLLADGKVDAHSKQQLMYMGSAIAWLFFIGLAFSTGVEFISARKVAWVVGTSAVLLAVFAAVGSVPMSRALAAAWTLWFSAVLCRSVRYSVASYSL